MTDFKVGYFTLSGATSKAYVTDADGEDQKVYSATDKYTDEDIEIEWNDDTETWEQIP